MSVSEPGKIITPWAESGLKNPIPPAANPATGRAGFDQGFSAINMTAKEAGGIPPFGQDFNGILFSITEVLRYMQAGGRPTFSATMATAIGGYPKGAVVLGNDGVTVYRNAVDSNSTNPNTGGAGWTNEQASETVLGMMKVATQAQTDAGTADDVAITPKKLRNGFSANFSASGYVALPSWMGGLIIQWGSVQFNVGSAVESTTTAQFTYPISFPNKAIAAFATNSVGVGVEGNECTTAIDSAGASSLVARAYRVAGNNAPGTEYFSSSIFLIGH